MADARVVVLGVGNVLMSDEGVGPHAIEAFAEGYSAPQGVMLVDGGTSAMELLDDMAGAELLLIMDAVASGSAPGTLIRLEGADVPKFFTRKLSPHQVGIADVMATLELTGESPKETIILGVEPGEMSMGMELSPAVACAVPRLLSEVVSELGRRGVEVRARH